MLKGTGVDILAKNPNSISTPFWCQLNSVPIFRSILRRFAVFSHRFILLYYNLSQFSHDSSSELLQNHFQAEKWLKCYAIAKIAKNPIFFRGKCVNSVPSYKIFEFHPPPQGGMSAKISTPCKLMLFFWSIFRRGKKN